MLARTWFPAYSRHVEASGTGEVGLGIQLGHRADGASAAKTNQMCEAPVADLDKIKRHRLEMYMDDGSKLPVQPAELVAGLTQADIDAQIPAG